MLWNCLSNNECYSSVEMKGVKTVKSMRANYGDGAVDYVQLLRHQSICTVEAKVCSEHRVRNKDYRVTLVIDEANEIVKEAKCHDCSASAGGCKHAVALLAWVYRRSEEPSPTEIVCYWHKPKLSQVASHIKYKRIIDIAQDCVAIVNSVENQSSNTGFLQKVLSHKESNPVKSHLAKLFQTSFVKKLSMHYNAVSYVGDKSNYEDFMNSPAINLSPDSCEIGYNMTKEQSESNLWYELCYGRITASIVYESAQCKKTDGYLVEKIMSMSNFDSVAMKRGRELEPQVLQKVSKFLNVKIEKCGLMLDSKYPSFGAPPDGVGESAVFEGKQKEYFCLANPGFESNGKVSVIVENFNRNSISAIMKRAALYWQNTIFPISMK